MRQTGAKTGDKHINKQNRELSLIPNTRGKVMIFFLFELNLMGQLFCDDFPILFLGDYFSSPLGGS